MVRSDFGSDYVTCRFLSEESMYAGLTREATRTFGRIDPKMESDFAKAYDIPSLPIWFTPGIFVHRKTFELDREIPVGQTKYNVLDEATPVTNKNTVYDKKGNRVLKERGNIATFGSIEAVLPDQRVLTIAVSPDPNLLSRYRPQDVFFMGKKRTMFELLEVSEVMPLQEEELQETVPVQVQMEQLSEYHSYTIHDVNARYFLVDGRAAKTWTLDAQMGAARLKRALPQLFVDRAMRLFDRQ
jgi:hypothetical protein